HVRHDQLRNHRVRKEFEAKRIHRRHQQIPRIGVIRRTLRLQASMLLRARTGGWRWGACLLAALVWVGCASALPASSAVKRATPRERHWLFRALDWSIGMDDTFQHLSTLYLQDEKKLLAHDR